MLGHKTCTSCLVSQELKDFKKDSRRKDGYSSHCKACAQARNLEWRKNNPDKFNAIARSWKERNPEKHKSSNRNSTLKRNYGIDTSIYDKMLLNQSNCCKICKTHQSELTKALAVDHCHTTGKIRGLLCSDCNTAIGLLKDDPKLTIAATEYLKDLVK